MKKKCSKCREDKNIEEFGKDKSRKDGLFKYCKTCSKKYYQNNKEKVKKKTIEYYEKNKEKIKEYNKKNKLLKKEYMKKYRKNNKEKIVQKTHEYYLNNCKRKKEQNKKWRENNKVYINEKHKAYIKEKMKNDIQYKLSHSIRVRIRQAIKNNSKCKKTVELLGCSIKFLKHYLENKFRKGMSWNNYGKWHIDHIKPCIYYDLSNPEEQIKCFNYKNLQPLWASENCSKRGTI